MRRRPLTAMLLLGLGVAVSGCAQSYDAMDRMQEALHSFNPFGANEKRLPGQRRSLFPEGVPGVEQGVPGHLMPGAREQEMAVTADPPPVVVEEAPAARPARTAPTRTTAVNPPRDPAPRRQSQPRRPAAEPPADAVWPAPSGSSAPPPDTVWPAPPRASAPPPDAVWPEPPRAAPAQAPRQAQQRSASPPAQSTPSQPPPVVQGGGWAPPPSEPAPTVWPDPPR